MTTEIYRNTLLDNPNTFKSLTWVIFDEIHYLDDDERGSVWEEAIILTPLSVKFLCLSATVPNIDEISGWLENKLNRKTVTIIEHNRPVPLHFRFQCLGKIFDKWKQAKKEANSFLKNKYKYSKNYLRYQRYNNKKKKLKVRPIANRLFPLIKEIKNNNELPCIYFVFSRSKTESLAAQISNLSFLPPNKQKILSDKYNELCNKFNISNELSVKKLAEFIKSGVAYHHAGMLPTLKEVVEQLFTLKMIPMIFTTETFALGINMPARTVIFDSLRKYYSTGFDVLRSRDFYQMAGRAGRRGMDKEGFVYVRFIPTQTHPNDVENIIFGDTEPVMSKFNASYATVLNLYEKHNENVIDLYSKTLHHYQSGKRGRKRAMRKFLNRLALLKNDKFIVDKKLTKKAHFARWMFGHELYMAELYATGLLDELSPQELCFVSSCLVFEPRHDAVPPYLPKHFKQIFRELNRIYRKIHLHEVVNDIKPYVPPPHPHIGSAIDAWIKGANFNAVLLISRLDEGALIRYLRMTNQILRQITHAPYTSDSLVSNAHQAIKLINRGIVDAERQLRAELNLLSLTDK